MIWLAFVGLILLAMAGLPLFIVILSLTMLGFWYNDIPLNVIAIELYRLADTPLLLALPMFAFAGYVLAKSNTSQRLVRLTQAFVGSFRSGLAVVALVTCAFFTAFTGASGVTIVALGALLYPALRSAGYPERFSLGLVTSSGSLGLLLAPSLPLILYGVIAQQMDVGVKFTIQDLFLAGIVPVLIMVVLLTVWSTWSNRHVNLPIQPFELKEVRAALWQARYELPLPVLVLGGVYSGYFVISEAAIVTACYVLIVEVFLYREIHVNQLFGIIRESMLTVGSILMILGVALAFTSLLVDIEAPQLLLEFVRNHVSSPWAFLLLLNVVLLLLGAILDIFSALVIMTPLLLPVAMGYDIHPVHLGIIFLANMQIGYFTPPIGMNLFIASYRFRKPVTELYRACLPFMLVLMLAVLLITYVPWFSLVFID